jgi:hypothetical protein
MTESLSKMASSLRSSLERRLLAEYGAVFVTTATPPPAIIFKDAAEVERFQASLSLGSDTFGEHTVELQSEAVAALRRAADELRDRGKTISARAADSGGRSYADTVSLWTRNVTRGMAHWLELNRIGQEDATRILGLAPVDQVAIILELEESEELYFGTYFNRSILYSVAAPGASQHLAMLAFDVAEYEDRSVEQSLNRHGWYRTVANDLPHFTYLGHVEDRLPDLGLKLITREYGEASYQFWVPDLEMIEKHNLVSQV